MSKNKLLILLFFILILVLAAGAYLWIHFKPKNISFSPDTNIIKQSDEQVTRKASEAQAQNSTLQAQTQNLILSQNQDTQEKQNTQNTQQNAQSLRAEYEALLKEAKRDTSLGEPRYEVYILNNAKLNELERQTINSITRTLSQRGAYNHYSLFVQRKDKQNLSLYLFNQNLLDETKFFKPENNIEPLLFKFNQSSVQSIKNSFYIDEFKAVLDSDSKLRSLSLSGHTDELGDEAYNYMLGLKRAGAVASEFLRFSAKINLFSFGKDKELSTQKDEKYRYINRRVESDFK